MPYQCSAVAVCRRGPLHLILAEYDEVTARPRFGFVEDERRVLIDTLSDIAEPVLARPLRVSLPDPDDRMFVEVAVAGAADAIVTGNAKHWSPRSGRVSVPVLGPRRAVDRMRR